MAFLGGKWGFFGEKEGLWSFFFGEKGDFCPKKRVLSNLIVGHESHF